jgi:hypothetical protein
MGAIKDNKPFDLIKKVPILSHLGHKTKTLLY